MSAAAATPLETELLKALKRVRNTLQLRKRLTREDELTLGYIDAVIRKATESKEAA